MDTELYKNYLTIIETGNLTAAAEKLHLSQPSLSKQIKVLEEFYGGQLLILKRGKKEIILTEAGRILYEKAKYICSLEDTTKNEIAGVNGGIVGVLRLSVAYSRSPLFISRSIKYFHQLYPKISYEMYEGIASVQTEQLLSGMTEIGITTTELSRPEYFDILFSRPEQMVAVFNVNSTSLSNKETLTLKDLKDIPISLSAGGAELFQRVSVISNFAPSIMSINTTKSTALQWARENMAVAIVTAEVGECFGKDLVVKKINDSRFELQKNIVKVKDRPLSKIAQKFLDFYGEQRKSEMIK